jgi:hypothetical protein
MDALKELVTKLEAAFSGRLVSVTLYGSAATPGWSDRFSDFNVLCVVKEVTPKELGDFEPVLTWWQAQGHRPVLLMSEEEVYNSADSFPIEFRDMQRRRKVLFGIDPIADLKVDDAHYRTQVEYELRSKLLRLRQQGAAVLSDQEQLLVLCADSVSTFCVLGRHVLTLAGVTPPDDRRELVKQLAATLRTDLSVLEALLDIREAKAPTAPNAMELFGRYLVSVGKLVVFVDQVNA